MIKSLLTKALPKFIRTLTPPKILAHAMLAGIVGIVPTVFADDTNSNAVTKIEFTQEHSQITKEILQLLAAQHYESRELDDDFAGDVYDKYLSLLDPARSYISEEDLAGFNYLTTQLDDLLAQGNLEAMAQLYNLLQDRRLAFVDYSLAVLTHDDSMFDFNVDETIRVSPYDEPWLKDFKAVKERWRKQLKNEFVNGQLNNETHEQVRERLLKRYTNMRKRLTQVELKDAYQTVSNSITTVTDPHTSYLSPRNVEDFNIDMSLSLEGIGAILQAEDDYTKVVRLVVGGPADKAGELKASDYIVGVSQEGQPIQEILGWRLDDVVDQIRGPKDSIVNLQIIPDGDIQQPKKTIQIRRNKVKLEDQAAKKSVIQLETQEGLLKFGVITLPTFYMDFEAARQGDPNYRSTTRDVYNLIQELNEESISGLIIDLRNNGGGSLHEANQLTGLFIETGTTVQVRYADGTIEKQIDRNPFLAYTGPIAVLVNRYSASASEIFAAAMQDYKRALVVGTQTYGKGTVQTFGNLSSGQIKYTQAKFYRVSGASTQNKGVIPDVILPTLEDPERVGESTHDHALKWDQVRPVDHKTYFSFETIVPYLQSQQELRNAENVDWQYTLAVAAKEQDRPTELSLNIDKRKAYWEGQKDWYLHQVNQLRQGQELEPVADVEDHDFDYEDTQRDPYVLAGGQVIADWIHMARSYDGH